MIEQTSAKKSTAPSQVGPEESRRSFLRRSSIAAMGGSAIINTLPLVRSAHAAGSDILRVGLVGCGSRGTGAATQALQADPQVKLVAMGDAFADRLQSSLKTLADQPRLAEKLDVPPERQFVGFDACQKVLDCDLDVILLATSPHFRPAHLRAAVEKGVHIFAEKPVAVDAPGVRHVLETVEMAKAKGISLVSGLCLRYWNGYREAVKRLQDGMAGEITSIEANEYRNPVWVRPRREEWSDMEYQMRNWYYFTWLSGDFNVEQHVHYLDVCAWLMRETYPVRAVGMGGRQVRTGPSYGNIFDHHSVVYEYENGVKLYSNTRQMAGCQLNLSVTASGTRGRATLFDHRKTIKVADGDTWMFRGPDNDPYQTEHNELFASIRSGTPINNGGYTAQSTMLAIMGRMATYTGQEVTWDAAFNSKEDLSPKSYDWGSLDPAPVAIPGVTPFI